MNKKYWEKQNKKLNIKSCQIKSREERERELLLCVNSIIDHLFHSYMLSDSYRNEMKVLAINIASVFLSICTYSANDFLVHSGNNFKLCETVT